MDQHSARPKVIEESCIACGACVEVCPEEALTIRDDHAHIDYSKCIGCGECMTVCRSEGIDLDWGSDIAPFNERVAEYALAALKGKGGKVGFINFVTRVSPDCDCVPWSDAPIVRDIGILASIDPVALDHACFDLVNAENGLPGTMLSRNMGPGEDKFKGLRGKTDGIRQLAYGKEIGLGDLAYELVRI